ncbi:MAG: Gfo/Idh/MocA family oxidoreductase [Planctomycetes bacterium]|nr:Gfo/Idh/MocA family oxidoreductase [Planctomycetota bacterium]
MSPAPLRVAVIGVGHLGRFHAKIHAENPRAELLGVVDANPERAASIAAEARTRAFSRVEDLPAVDAVSIAVPTVHHAAVAVPLLERGVSCLIEKPLASSVEDADRILEAAARGGARVAVGHVERFQPGLRKVRELGLRPKFIECHRLAPFSFRSMDIGVVHDLMIHDLDLVLDLMGSEVVSLDAAGGAILTDNEDVASVRLVFENGARANVTASRASLQPMRRFRMFSPESYVSLDFQKNYGLLVRKGPKWEEGRLDLRRMDPAELAKRPDFLTKDLLEVVELELSAEQRPLQAEIDSFLRAVQEGREVEVTGHDGRRALVLADRIAAEIRAQAW